MATTPRLVPPPIPLADARGYPEMAWLDYWQALGDRLARLEGKLPGGGTTPPPSGGGGGSGGTTPPAGWVRAVFDPMDKVGEGEAAINTAIWSQPSYGDGQAHNGAGQWAGTDGWVGTADGLQCHVWHDGNAWRMSGMNARHLSFGQAHVRFKMKLSHAHAPGIGAYVLFYPVTDEWTTEIDIVELPGADKTKLEAAVHVITNGVDDSGTAAIDGHDLTQWRTIDFRRAYGAGGATCRMWVDGVPYVQDWNPRFTDNPGLMEQMMPGIAGYAAWPDVYGWYSAPDASTPQRWWMTVKDFEVFVPA